MTSRITLLASILLLLSALRAEPVKATIYTYIDENGRIHLTNVPIDSRFKPGFEAISRQRNRMDPISYEPYIRAAAMQYTVDPLLIRAVIQAESNFNRHAVSRKGAKGLMQLMPGTAQDMEVSNPFDPEANIRGGTRYLKKMLGLFNGDLSLALAAYNAGPETVKLHGKVPDYPETNSYIRKVMGLYRKLTDDSSPSKKWAGDTY